MEMVYEFLNKGFSMLFVIEDKKGIRSVIMGLVFRIYPSPWSVIGGSTHSIKGQVNPG